MKIYLYRGQIKAVISGSCAFARVQRSHRKSLNGSRAYNEATTWRRVSSQPTETRSKEVLDVPLGNVDFRKVFR